MLQYLSYRACTQIDAQTILIDEVQFIININLDPNQKHCIHTDHGWRDYSLGGRQKYKQPRYSRFLAKDWRVLALDFQFHIHKK